MMESEDAVKQWTALIVWFRLINLSESRFLTIAAGMGLLLRKRMPSHRRSYPCAHRAHSIHPPNTLWYEEIRCHYPQSNHHNLITTFSDQAASGNSRPTSQRKTAPTPPNSSAPTPTRPTSPNPPAYRLSTFSHTRMVTGVPPFSWTASAPPIFSAKNHSTPSKPLPPGPYQPTPAVMMAFRSLQRVLSQSLLGRRIRLEIDIGSRR